MQLQHMFSCILKFVDIMSQWKKNHINSHLLCKGGRVASEYIQQSFSPQEDKTVSKCMQHSSSLKEEQSGLQVHTVVIYAKEQSGLQVIAF